MKRQLCRRVSCALVFAAVSFVLAGCSTAAPSNYVEQSAAASKNGAAAAELKSRSRELGQYMEENFGGGYGQDPVSWYSSIKSMEFTDSDHLLIKTDLKADNGSQVRSITTAIKFYDDLPASVRIHGAKDVVLFATN